MAANRHTCAPSQLHVRRLRPGAERHRALCSCVRLSPGRLVPRQLLLGFLSLEQIGMLVGGAVGSGSPFLLACAGLLPICAKKKKLMNDGTKELMDPGCGARGALRCCAVTGLPVSLVTAPELARNNHYCLSQSLISKVYIIASLIFSEGRIESSPVGVGLVGKSTGASAEVNEVD